MKEIVIIGAGDFGKEIAWLIEDINKKLPTYIVLGFLDDDPAKKEQALNGYEVLGDVSYLWELNKNHHACAVIAMQDGKIRKRIVNSLKGFAEWETLIHPSVSISRTSTIGAGSIVCAGTYVSVNTTVGNQCILNIGCTIENDCVIEDYASIMSRSIVESHSSIGEYSFLGSNSTVVCGKKIESNVTVGAGSVVIDDIPVGKSVIGVPAKQC